MTDEQYAFWLDYIGRCAAAMNLQNWRVHLSNERPEDEERAVDIRVFQGADVMELRLSDSFLSDVSPQRQRRYIAHELVHCYIEPIMHHVDILQMGYGMEAWRVFSQALNITAEYAVDRLATLVAELLPLPTPNGSESPRKRNARPA